MKIIPILTFSFVLTITFPITVFPWSNGLAGNTTTDNPAECSSPPYGTHDWIADHALDLLPEQEKAWLLPHKTMYLLGTEAPDNDDIPSECSAPNNGYDDRRKGRSVEWAADWSGFKTEEDGSVKDRAARRAQEEYDKAVSAYESGNLSHAAYYLGAMAHYIGDASQYGHAVPFEEHHSDYESWVDRRTDSFNEGDFESYIELDYLVRRRSYTAVKRISKVTAGGKGKILWATKMDEMYETNRDSQQYLDSIGYSLTMGVNKVADVLHTIYLNVIQE